ncbi:MAG: hypothetical protein ABR539_12640 [Halomonas sp.]
MQQTISQAAKLYGKARSTIHRAIDAGRLSCGVRGDGVRVIDLAELIRLWGEPPNAPAQTQQNATHEEPDTQQAMLQELKAMRRELVALREEVAQLRALPAPEATKTPTQALIDKKQDDDPHGLRSLARALYNSGDG